jgi:nitroreductase
LNYVNRQAHLEVKEMETVMNVSEAIRFKRAVREFSQQPISDENVTHILNAGRRAQSAKNRQQWEFIAIRDRDVLSSLAKCATNAPHLAHAALGIAILTPDPAQRWSIMFDAGQAAAYMQLAAWEQGIGSCLATIYETEDARNLLSFPPELYIRATISFGYPKDPSIMKAPLRTGGRKPLASTIHYEHWSQK